MVGRRENAVHLSLRHSFSLAIPLHLSTSPYLRYSVACPPGNILDQPAYLLGYLSQSHLGVGRHGMSHHRHQMAIRKAVGVSERTLQIEAGGAVDRRQAFRLSHAERMRARDSTREAPVVDLKLRTDPRINAQS